MRKQYELSNPNSCLNKAHDDETLFVLLARDPAAPSIIHAWVQERIRLGKNQLADDQIVDAIETARDMEWWRNKNVPKATNWKKLERSTRPKHIRHT